MSLKFRDLLVAAAAGSLLLACGAGDGKAGSTAGAERSGTEARQQSPASPPTGGPAASAATPRPAPDFSINLPDGSKLPIRQFRGKIVALVFISTVCPHCQEVTQALNGIQEEYGPKGVQILMSAMDEKAPSLLPAYIQRFRPTYPVGWNPHQESLAFLQIPVVAPGYVPKVAFIDRKGVIQAQYGGEHPMFKNAAVSFRAELDRLLAASPAGKKGRKK